MAAEKMWGINKTNSHLGHVKTGIGIAQICSMPIVSEPTGQKYNNPLLSTTVYLEYPPSNTPKF